MIMVSYAYVGISTGRKTEVTELRQRFAVICLRGRVREYGIKVGGMETGEQNSIADVRGVSVGHVTLIQGEGKLVPGRGPVRTGVTVILPHEGSLFNEKLRAGVHVQNGAGELTGTLQVMEWGVLETPIALTNSLNVGLVHDAVVEYMLQKEPDIGIEADVVLPVVGECDDSYLNDIRGRHVKREHVLEAAGTASEKVVEGSVGGGTGMSAMGFKAGIGTASRKTGKEFGHHTVGVLVNANFSGELRVNGIPVGRRLQTKSVIRRESRSIITVIATDAPLTSLQLRRVGAHVPLALGRVGSTSASSSGDISIAFSTAERLDRSFAQISGKTEAVNSETIDELFRATVEATEEAVLNSVFTSETMKGRDDHVSPSLPVEEALEIMKTSGGL